MRDQPIPGVDARPGDAPRSLENPAPNPVLEALPVGVAVLDSQRRILSANPTFVRSLGMTAGGRLVGRELAAFAPEDLVRSLNKYPGAGARDGPFVCRWAAGARPVAAEVRIVDLDHDRCALVVSEINDRPLLDETRQQYRHLEGLASLARGLAHDFNNVLAIIMGHAGLLADPATEPKRRPQIGDTIIDACRRAAATVRQVACLAGQPGTAKSEIDLHEVLAGAIFRQSWPDKVSVVRNFRAPRTRLMASSRQIEQCLDHLFAAALDAMPRGGTLTVSTEIVALKPPGREGPPVPYLRLIVGDTGEVADRANLPAGAPADAAADRRCSLGLAVVHAVARFHHGFVDIHSAPGVGTGVHLCFPSSLPVMPRLTGRAPAEARPSEHRTVLLVEDEDDIGVLFTEVLRRHNIPALWARDGEEALSLYERHAPVIGIVFTDIGLPGMDGVELAGRLRSLNPRLPVLFASGYFQSGLTSRFAGAPTGYLQKPYDYLQAVARIHQMLGGASGRN